MASETNIPRQYVPGDVIPDWIAEEVRWMAQIVIQHGGHRDGTRILRQMDQGKHLSRTAVNIAWDNTFSPHNDGLSRWDKQRAGILFNNLEELSRPNPNPKHLMSAKPERWES